MAKPLVFKLGDAELSFSMGKVDRSKLYGYKELLVVDEQQRPCDLATLADDGHTVVGRGGTGIGYVSAEGQWCDKKQLKPVDLEGNEIEPVPSSFAAPIELNRTATSNEYLEHNIRLVYQLDAEDDALQLKSELADGTIYTFPYSYRGGLEADAGFLLQGEDGNVFFAVGNPTKLQFIGLQQTGPLMEEEDEAAEDFDMMDFDMI